MTRRRRALGLVEALVAVALVAGPLLIALQLVGASVRGATFHADRATARLALMDALDALLAQPTARLAAACAPGNAVALEALVPGRLPEGTRIAAAFDRDAGGQPGLARVRLTLTLSGGASVEVVRLFRPAARYGAGG